MIAFFRKTLASKLALGLLALVLLAFIVTGVFTHELPGASSLAGDPGDALAAIGDRKITAQEMETRLRAQVARYAQQQPGLDMAAFVRGGGFEATVDQTIRATALEEFGKEIGLAASPRMIDGQIAGIQAFKNAAGQFDPQIFRAAIAQQRMTEPQLRRDIEGDSIRQMLYLPAAGAVKLPDGLLRPYAALLVEQRQGSVGLVPTVAAAGGPPPGDVELQRFYRANAAAYMIPERRVLRYAVIGRDQVSAATTPSEAEVRKVYDANPQRYGARQNRTLTQVVLDSQAKAAAFAAAVKSGKPFAAAAQGLGFGPADIAVSAHMQAEFAKQTAPAVAAAAFATPKGGITTPVRSDLGWHVVKVDAVDDVAATPFETARPQIAGDLAKAKQETALAALVGKVQDALDGGGAVIDIARANGLAIEQTPPVTAAGIAPGHATYQASADVKALVKAGFATSPDQPATVETVQAGERYALLAVGQVVPAAPQPFAEIRERLVADFTAKRASDRAKAIASAILAKVKAGTSMADAFKAAPVPLPAPRDGSGRRIDLARAGVQQVPASLRALFTMAAGGVKLVPAEQATGWYVVQLKRIVPADPRALPPLIAATRGDVTQAAGDEYADQLAAAAARSVGVRRNEAAIAALRRRLLGEAPAAP